MTEQSLPVPLVMVTVLPRIEQAPLTVITAVVLALVVEATVKVERYMTRGSTCECDAGVRQSYRYGLLAAAEGVSDPSPSSQKRAGAGAAVIVAVVPRSRTRRRS